MQNFLLFFAILARVQDQEKRANRLSISEMSKRLPGNSLTLSVINHLNHPQATFPSSNPTILQVTSEVTAMSKKYSIVERLVQSGRENDTLECFKQAIALGSFPARADLALLCFNRNLTYPECREAFSKMGTILDAQIALAWYRVFIQLDSEESSNVVMKRLTVLHVRVPMLEAGLERWLWLIF